MVSLSSLPVTTANQIKPYRLKRKIQNSAVRIDNLFFQLVLRLDYKNDVTKTLVYLIKLLFLRLAAIMLHKSTKERKVHFA